MTSEATALSWEARRHGDVYCAPACGRGCTKAEHDAAMRLARETARLLGVGGWKPEVWENLGWHAKAVDGSGRWKVHPQKNAEGQVVSYTAYLNKRGDAGGVWAESAKTPIEAVKKTLDVARKHVLALSALLYNPFDVDARRALRREQRRRSMSPAEKAEYDMRVPGVTRRKSRAR